VAKAKTAKAKAEEKEYKREERQVKGSTLIEVIEELIREGQVRRITILDHEDRVLISFPVIVGVPLGVATAMMAPTMAAVGAIAGLVTGCKLIIEREEE
jgi:hypothetical protein